MKTALIAITLAALVLWGLHFLTLNLLNLRLDQVQAEIDRMEARPSPEREYCERLSDLYLTRRCIRRALDRIS